MIYIDFYLVKISQLISGKNQDPRLYYYYVVFNTSAQLPDCKFSRLFSLVKVIWNASEVNELSCVMKI